MTRWDPSGAARLAAELREDDQRATPTIEVPYWFACVVLLSLRGAVVTISRTSPHGGEVTP